MTIADALDYSYEMSEQDVDDQLRLRMMIFLQNNMDYENLAGTLIKRKSVDLMFQLLDMKELRKKNRKLAIFCSFKESL